MRDLLLPNRYRDDRNDPRWGGFLRDLTSALHAYPFTPDEWDAIIPALADLWPPSLTPEAQSVHAFLRVVRKLGIAVNLAWESPEGGAPIPDLAAALAHPNLRLPLPPPDLGALASAVSRIYQELSA